MRGAGGGVVPLLLLLVMLAPAATAQVEVTHLAVWAAPVPLDGASGNGSAEVVVRYRHPPAPGASPFTNVTFTVDTGESFVRARVEPPALLVPVAPLGGEASGTARLFVEGLRQYRDRQANNTFTSAAASLVVHALAAQNGPLPPAYNQTVAYAQGPVPTFDEGPVVRPSGGPTVTGGRDDSAVAAVAFLALAAGAALAVRRVRRRRR